MDKLTDERPNTWRNWTVADLQSLCGKQVGQIMTYEQLIQELREENKLLRQQLKQYGGE